MLNLSRSFRHSGILQALDGFSFALTRQVTIKVVPPKKKDKNESYDVKNMRLKREMSPHLSIYKTQLTSLLSISHRITGMAISTYAWTLGLSALFCSHDLSHYETMIEGLQLSDATLIGIKCVLAYPFCFHTCNGIRQLTWGTGRFLKLNQIYATGYVMIIAAILMTVGISML